MISEAQAAEAPRIVIPTRPLEVPPELLALQPDAVVCYSQAKNPGAYLQSAFGTAAEAIRLVRDTIARQAAGRFYIFEVAQILADANGFPARVVLRDMHRAVEDGRLRFRDVADLPVGPGDPRGEYMTPADLNSWLEGQGAGYRFPAPPTAEASTHAPSASASPAARPEAVAAPAAPEVPDSASAPAVAQPEAVPDGKPEAAEARQDRRLLELRSMGADFVPHGKGWRVTGKRGALAALVEREAGRPMGTKDGVRKDLQRAVQRERERNGRLSR